MRPRLQYIDGRWKFLRGKTQRYVRLTLETECGNIAARPLYIIVGSTLPSWSLNDIDPSSILYVVSTEQDALTLAFDMTAGLCERWNDEESDDVYVPTRHDGQGKDMIAFFWVSDDIDSTTFGDAVFIVR